MSRLQNENSEWRLSPIVFERVLKVFHPDKNAMVVDAFSISWSELNFYAFPPFSLLGAAITKFRHKQCSGIMIMSWWTTQFWFPMMESLLRNFPIFRSQIY